MLAIIPARGGSKGVHKKNIKEFSGKPLIFWTIEAAIKSKNIDKIILSTNDYEIVEACSIYKELEVPFMRPDELAEDTSLAVDTYIFTIEKLKEDQNIVLILRLIQLWKDVTYTTSLCQQANYKMFQN